MSPLVYRGSLNDNTGRKTKSAKKAGADRNAAMQAAKARWQLIEAKVVTLTQEKEGLQLQLAGAHAKTKEVEEANAKLKTASE